MCQTCFAEYGSPRHITPETVACSEAIGRVYDLHSCGGNLHIVIDDWNLEDESIQWCLENMTDGSPEQQEAERECARLLQGMSEEYRASALGIFDGFITGDEI